MNNCHCDWMELRRCLVTIAENNRVWICLFGSATTGEFSQSEHPPIRFSDIDLLVVCDQQIASEVAWQLQDSFPTKRRPGEQFFKLSPKFRLPTDLTIEKMTANEVVALRFGEWFPEHPPIPSFTPSPLWYKRQSVLALQTRWAYDRERWISIMGSPHQVLHEQYLSCRIVLELATALLLAHQTMTPSYSSRVCLASRLYPELSDLWEDALCFKTAPLQCRIGFECWKDPQSTWEQIKGRAKEAGLVERTSQLEPVENFPQVYRPLDRRRSSNR